MIVRVACGLVLVLSAVSIFAMFSGRSSVENLLAFEAARPKNIAIYLADPRFGLAVNVTNDLLNNTEPVWSPDGRLTFMSSVLLNQDIYTLTLDQLEPINVSHTSHSHSPVWSPSGRLAYVTEHTPEPNSIDVLNPDGSRQSYTVALSPDLIDLESPSWLSDHRLIFLGSVQRGQKQVFLLDLDDSALQNISNELKLTHRDPIAAPSGDRVAFISDDLSRAQVRQTISVWEKTNDTVLRVTTNTGLNGELNWSNDGRLAFASTMNGNSEIYVWNVQTGVLENMSNDAGVDEFPSWAGDGTLAFVSNRSGEAGIYTIDPLTLLIQKVYILHGSSFPVWSN